VQAGPDGLAFGIASLGVTYRGTMQDGRISGDYSFAGQTIPVIFQREPLPYPVPVKLDGAANAGFDGEWFGLLGAGPQALQLRLEVSGESIGVAAIQQGNVLAPADIVAIDGADVFFRVTQVDASYLGRLEDGRIIGVFTQLARQQPLNFQRTPIDQNAPVDALTEEMLDSLLQQSGAPGIAAAAGGARNTLSLAAGVRNVSTGSPVTTDDIWHLGSITKSTTSTLVAKLAELGHLSWDDTVGGILGAIIPEMRADYRDMNFRHLCSHTAKIQGTMPPDRAAQFGLASADPGAERIAASRIVLQLDPVENAPGATYTYSNNGYAVAGAMLESIMDRPWEALMAEHVFAPLGMRRAGIGAVTGADQPSGHVPDPATGALVPIPVTMVPGDIPAFMGPAGRAYAPFEDVLRYLAAHRDRDPYLNGESWGILHTPPFGGDYAMGWIVRPDGLWHNGSIGSWYAETLFDPARGVTSVAACNLGQLGGVNAAIATALAAAAEAVA
jgi:CubicO group peptidase (beta-lactamase class C family)